MSGEQPAHVSDDLCGAPTAAAASWRPPPRSFAPASGASTPLSVDVIGGSGSCLGTSSRDGGGVLTCDVPSRPVTDTNDGGGQQPRLHSVPDILNQDFTTGGPEPGGCETENRGNSCPTTAVRIPRSRSHGHK
jgi:hypothetical protein